MQTKDLVAGRELDQKVAEARGLKPCVFQVRGSFSAWATIWGCEHGDDTSKCFPSNEFAVDHGHSPLRKYSTSISDAMPLIQELIDEGHTIEMSFVSDLWMIGVVRPQPIKTWHEGDKDIKVAISLAYLAVKEAHEPSND